MANGHPNAIVLINSETKELVTIEPDNNGVLNLPPGRWEAPAIIEFKLGFTLQGRGISDTIICNRDDKHEKTRFDAQGQGILPFLLE